MRRIMSFFRSPLGLLVFGLALIYLYSRWYAGHKAAAPYHENQFGLDAGHIAATGQPVVHTAVGQSAGEP